MNRANAYEQFREAVKKAMTVTLATAANGRVTMRVVSPVYHDGGILIFTADSSTKLSPASGQSPWLPRRSL